MKRFASLVPALTLLGGASSLGAAEIQETFVEPPEISGKAGVVEATFEVKEGRIRVGDQDVTTTVYNGLFVPPVLRARPGDLLRIRLVNSGDETTNIHFHGLNVSPQASGDNVFVHVH